MANRRKLDNWMKLYMRWTENTEPPYLYRFWSGMSVLAATMQRKCWLKWDRVLYPNLYIVLVGRSGVRKGTAMYPAEDLLRSLEIHLASEAVTREALIIELRKTTQADLDPSTGIPRKFSSLTVFSKEFTVFLGYNNPQLIMDLTDWYDCSDLWRYRTKTQGTDEIHGVFVNLIGATTPTQLQTALPIDAIGGGLCSRMIFVYEEEKGKIVTFPDGIKWDGKEEEATKEILEANREIKEELLDDLMIIKQERGEWVFDYSFKAAWADWYKKNEENTSFQGTFLEPYHTRRGTHVLKLCMIFNVNRNGRMVITADDLAQADRLLTTTEEKMSYTFSGVGRSELSFILNQVISILTMEKKILYSELLRKLSNDASDAELSGVINTLYKMRNISLKITKGGEDTEITFIPAGV